MMTRRRPKVRPRKEPSRIEKKTRSADFFHPTARRLFLAAMFVAAFWIRIIGIDGPPIVFHSTRQYRSALIARAYYYRLISTVDEAKREAAMTASNIQGILEPPIMEYLACAAYWVAGGEHLWLARILSVIFWLVGGGFLYVLAKRMVSADAGLVAAAFFLFLPYGVVASRSFQPDPLMVMMMIICLFSLLLYWNELTRRRLALAAGTAALGVFVKPICIFMILPAFALVGLYQLGLRRIMRHPGLYVFAAASILPAIGFYSYGYWTGGKIVIQSGGSFIPSLLNSEQYWFGWLFVIDKVVSHVAVIGALVGVIVLRRSSGRRLLAGLLIGYVVYGLAFNYHIHTHDYYQLPFVPIVALGLSALADPLLKALHQSRPGPKPLLQLATLAGLGLIIGIHVKSPTPPTPGVDAYEQVSSTRGHGIARISKKIGELVNHSASTVAMSTGYGKPLQYHGELAGRNWPSRAVMRSEHLRGRPILSAEERFARLMRGRPVEYFITTALKEFNAQTDLKQLLERRGRILASTRSYLIYDLRPTTAD